MTTIPSFEGDITLRFLFANFDGINKEITFSYGTKISEVKERLLANWPEKVTQTTAAGMRLLTAGRMLEDGKTLAESKVPKYPEHATPVNISFLPKGRSYTEVSSSTTRPDVKPSSTTNNSSNNANRSNNASAGGGGGGNASSSGQRTTTAGGGGPSSGGCCVVC
jgi:hypothetical protein